MMESSKQDKPGISHHFKQSKTFGTVGTMNMNSKSILSREFIDHSYVELGIRI
jgi:hypothetical protein